jgi:hypothetical protein
LDGTEIGGPGNMPEWNEGLVALDIFDDELGPGAQRPAASALIGGGDLAKKIEKILLEPSLCRDPQHLRFGI